MVVEWDQAKAGSNLLKHGVSFDFAVGVFEDPGRLEELDETAQTGEQRWETIGIVNGIELCVVYTIRGEALRLISARKVNRHERKSYWHRSI